PTARRPIRQMAKNLLGRLRNVAKRGGPLQRCGMRPGASKRMAPDPIPEPAGRRAALDRVDSPFPTLVVACPALPAPGRRFLGPGSTGTRGHRLSHSAASAAGPRGPLGHDARRPGAERRREDCAAQIDARLVAAPGRPPLLPDAPFAARGARPAAPAAAPERAPL